MHVLFWSVHVVNVFNNAHCGLYLFDWKSMEMMRWWESSYLHWSLSVDFSLPLRVGVVPEGVPTHPCWQDGSQPQPQELLRWGGADCLCPSSHDPRHWALSWQDVAGISNCLEFGSFLKIRPFVDSGRHCLVPHTCLSVSTSKYWPNSRQVHLASDVISQ